MIFLYNYCGKILSIGLDMKINANKLHKWLELYIREDIKSSLIVGNMGNSWQNIILWFCDHFGTFGKQVHIWWR